MCLLFFHLVKAELLQQPQNGGLKNRDTYLSSASDPRAALLHGVPQGSCSSALWRRHVTCDVLHMVEAESQAPAEFTELGRGTGVVGSDTALVHVSSLELR